MRDDDKKIKAVPDLSMSADERPERRQPRASTSRKPVSAAPKPEPQKSGNGLSWFLLILVLGIGGAGGWQFWQLQQKLEETRFQLDSTEENLTQVTGEVSATGENLTKRDTSLRSELKEVNSEIRKLWDVSNKRNRKWIETNKANITKATRLAESANKSADAVSKNVAALTKEVDDTEQILKAIGTEQVAVQSEMTLTLQSISEQISASQTQIDQLKQQLDQQVKRNAQLEAQLKDQADAVKSMDQFRQQMNRKMTQVESTVREYTRPPEEGLGLQ